MDQKTKTVFQLDSPYTQTHWPEISTQDQDTILELLCSLLSPIGQWRSDNIIPSKGKRSKKRKRQEAKSEEILIPDQPKPPRPEIASFILVGLNSITRRMKSFSQASSQEAESNESASAGKSTRSGNTGGIESNARLTEHLPVENIDQNLFTVIFALESSQPIPLYAHFRQLVITSSLANPSLPTTRHVRLPLGSDARLCEALGLARISFLGILEGAPHSKALVNLIKRVVPEAEVPWLKEVKNAGYLPVKIKAIETTIGVAKEKKQLARQKKST